MQQSVSDRPPLVCPLNEINFLSWAVEEGYFPRVGPRTRLVQAAAGADRDRGREGHSAAMARTRQSLGRALVHVAPTTAAGRVRAAEQYLQGQFEAYDWIIGRAEPELGGDPSLVDMIGFNFYPHNQWYLDGPTIPMGHHEYRALSEMLCEVAERYGKPIFISETGRRAAGDRPGSITSAARFARRWAAGSTSAASAGTRSRLIRAGTIHGTRRPDSFALHSRRHSARRRTIAARNGGAA